MVELLGIDLIEHVAGIVDFLLGPNGFTSVREPDTSLQIDDGAEHEITVNDCLVEVAGSARFLLQVERESETERERGRKGYILVRVYVIRSSIIVELRMQFMSNASAVRGKS